MHVKYPITVKRSIELLGLFLVGALFVFGQNIIMPMLLAFLLSVILLPLYRFFRRKRVPNILSIILCLLVLITFGGLVIWFFSFQMSKLVEDFPQIRDNITVHINNFSDWIYKKLHFTSSQQLRLIKDQNEKIMNWAGNILEKAAGSVTILLTYLALVPLYIFLFLLYKNLLLRFIFMWFKPVAHRNVAESLRATEAIIKSYLGGLMIQVSYMTILLGGILTLIGIEHALLIGIIFAFLNLIPYIGALIGNLIGVLLTLSSTQELWPVLAVLGTIAFVQFVDNNILMPRIVGSKVKINALATIAGVIIGGALAGVPGMFLSLPLLATMKVIFEHTENFKQWAVLLGEDNPKKSPVEELGKVPDDHVPGADDTKTEALL
jgi:predicted PurR-regulated permease PerM